MKRAMQSAILAVLALAGCALPTVESLQAFNTYAWHWIGTGMTVLFGCALVWAVGAALWLAVKGMKGDL